MEVTTKFLDCKRVCAEAGAPLCDALAQGGHGGRLRAATWGRLYCFLTREKKSAIEPKPEPEEAELRA